MMKNIAKRGEGRVAEMKNPLPGILGNTERQWTVWTEQSEMTRIEHRTTRGFSIAAIALVANFLQCQFHFLRHMERRRSKIKGRALRQADCILGNRPGVANARPVSKALLHQP